MLDKVTAIGFEPLGNPRDEFTKYVKSEIAQWSKVIREAGIKPQ
jgi:tripartite-type tricarboxylate transporter receptor subunit TctC